LDSTSDVIHIAPADQPSSVCQIADRLFPAYTIDDGAVRLAGCTLEDRFFVRLRFRHAKESVEFYLDADGRQLNGELVQMLKTTATVELDKPPEPAEMEIARLIELGTRLARTRLPSGSPPQRVDSAVLWYKYAEGKLRFSLGECSVDLPFAGWARTLEPPPLVCPYTGISTFHLAATDDGRVVAADSIERCAETGFRTLADDLVTCSVTGRRVVPEQVAACPVSGDRVLTKEMVRCAMCRQQVSPAIIEQNRCAACRNVRPVSKADPWMAKLLHEHPPLDLWRNWRISETATVYVLTASGWFKRLLVVVGKDSLELKLLATGSRLLAGWEAVDPSQYDCAPWGERAAGS